MTAGKPRTQIHQDEMVKFMQEGCCNQHAVVERTSPLGNAPKDMFFCSADAKDAWRGPSCDSGQATDPDLQG